MAGEVPVSEASAQLLGILKEILTELRINNYLLQQGLGPNVDDPDKLRQDLFVDQS